MQFVRYSNMNKHVRPARRIAQVLRNVYSLKRQALQYRRRRGIQPAGRKDRPRGGFFVPAIRPQITTRRGGICRERSSAYKASNPFSAAAIVKRSNAVKPLDSLQQVAGGEYTKR